MLRKFYELQGNGCIVYNKIPTVLTASELLDKAMGRAAKVEVSDRNKVRYERRLSITKLDSVSNIVQSTFSKYIRSFPKSEDMEPFYRELMDAALGGIEQMDRALKNLEWAFGLIQKISKGAVREIKMSEDVAEIIRIRKAAYGRISSIIDRMDPELHFLNRVRNTMRALPDIDTSAPIVVVAGAPNVGKSLLVSHLSSASPEVASYPFTTKGILLGHMDIGEGREAIRVQIIDTPGILDRPMEERNIIELQAITALRHLDALILFVFDPSETCGYDMEYQKSLLSGIEGAFKGREIVILHNKADMWREFGVKESDGVISISSATGEGIDDVRMLIEEKMMPSPD